MGWKRAAILCAVIGLSGCASAQRVQLSGSTAGYRVSCSGIQHRLADCYTKAAQVCPAGYDVISKDLSTTVLNPFQRSMLVSCRG